MRSQRYLRVSFGFLSLLRCRLLCLSHPGAAPSFGLLPFPLPGVPLPFAILLHPRHRRAGSGSRRCRCRFCRFPESLPAFPFLPAGMPSDSRFGQELQTLVRASAPSPFGSASRRGLHLHHVPAGSYPSGFTPARRSISRTFARHSFQIRAGSSSSFRSFIPSPACGCSRPRFRFSPHRTSPLRSTSSGRQVRCGASFCG